MTKALAALLLASSLPAAAAPDWSERTGKGTDWRQVDFTDELGTARKAYCRASECALDKPDASAAAVPLYLLAPKQNTSVVGLPYYEAGLAAHEGFFAAGAGFPLGNGTVRLAVRRAGVKRSMSGVSLSAAGPAKDDALVVKWTPGQQTLPVSAMSQRGTSRPCLEQLRAADYDAMTSGGDHAHKWFNTRFLVMEIELADNKRLLKSSGLDGMLSCKDCGDPGTEKDFFAGNRIFIDAYARKLREKTRKAARLAAASAGAPADKERLTGFEADMVTCLLDEGAPVKDPRKVYDVFDKSVREAALKGENAKFTARWRAYLKGELELYLSSSASAEGEIKDHKSQVDGIGKRSGAVLSGTDPASLFAGGSGGSGSTGRSGAGQGSWTDGAARRARDILKD